MPLLRNTDKSKISKRKNPAARLTWFVEQGYLPEALINFLALLGYGQPDESEIFTFEQFSASFDWTRVNTVGPVFDLDKLNWLNGHYLRELSGADLARRLLAHADRMGISVAADVVTAAAPLVQERVSTLAQGLEMLRFLLVPETEFAVDETAAAKQLGDAGQEVLAAALPALEALSEWTDEKIQDALQRALVDGLGLKPRNAYGPVRVAVTGSTVSPPLFESMAILGKDRSLDRVRAAITA
jgi:glutamyl-tRNA synthetase